MHWIPILLVLRLLSVSGSLSARHQESLAVHRLWYILCSCDELFATRSRMERILLPVANGSSQLHKMYQSRCTAKNSWWWAERLPKTLRVVIPIKLEFRASVGFIHKDSVTMHDHTIVKLLNWLQNANIINLLYLNRGQKRSIIHWFCLIYNSIHYFCSRKYKLPSEEIHIRQTFSFNSNYNVYIHYFLFKNTSFFH
jgi:hypothetical protein